MNERTTSCVPLKIKYSSPLETRPAEALRLAARAPGDSAAVTHIRGAAVRLFTGKEDNVGALTIFAM